MQKTKTSRRRHESIPIICIRFGEGVQRFVDFVLAA
jgi:hypothetical protein